MDRSALRITLVGVGAIGSAVLPLLRDPRISTVRLIDGDTVEQDNLPRQLLFHPADVGALKVAVAASRIAHLNPAPTMHAVPCFLDATNCAALLEDADVVLDCCDDLHAKRLIATHCRQVGRYLINAAVHGMQLQVSTQLPGAAPFFTGRIGAEQAACAMQHVPLPVIAVAAALMVQHLHGIAKGDDLRAEMLDVVDLDEGRWMRFQHPRDESPVGSVEAGMRKVPDA
jgi:molybdopterin/thiamine biosynthesis adenylyltransferase